MKAIITVDVPEHQIGQEVSIYFKDTMCVKSVCTPLTESDDCVNREQFDKCLYELRMNNAYDMPSFWCHDNKDYKVIPTKYNKGYERAIMDIEEKIAKLPSVQPNREKHDEEIIKETVASIWGKPPYTEVLDEIRAEIKHHSEHFIDDNGEDCFAIYEDDVLAIIDRHRKGDKE